MSNKIYTSQVLEILENGDALVEIPPELMEQMGWKEGDVLDCYLESDTNAIIIRKFPIAPNNY